MKKNLNVHSGKHAFTLAEVLITLGIIGVIAALTIPSLIANYQKKVVVTKLKKFYSTMSQAITLSEIDNGTAKDWNYNLEGDKFFDNYVKNYFKINTESKTKDFLSNYKMTNLNGTECTSYAWCAFGNNTFITLADGATLGISKSSSNGTMIIFIDINGHKKPNVMGKDIFIYCISKDLGRLVPYGYGKTGVGNGQYSDRNDLIGSTNADYACNKDSAGIWCSGLIMYDNWEIKDDYPW